MSDSPGSCFVLVVGLLAPLLAYLGGGFVHGRGLVSQKFVCDHHQQNQYVRWCSVVASPAPTTTKCFVRARSITLLDQTVLANRSTQPTPTNKTEQHLGVPSDDWTAEATALFLKSIVGSTLSFFMQPSEGGTLSKEERDVRRHVECTTRPNGVYVRKLGSIAFDTVISTG